MKTLRAFFVLVVPVIMVAWQVAAAGPARREFPASERDKAAIELLNRQGQELATTRKQLEDAEKKLRVRFEAVVAEIHSALALQKDEHLGYDAEKSCFYVAETAPVTTQQEKRP